MLFNFTTASVARFCIFRIGRGGVIRDVTSGDWRCWGWRLDREVGKLILNSQNRSFPFKKNKSPRTWFEACAVGRAEQLVQKLGPAALQSPRLSWCVGVGWLQGHLQFATASVRATVCSTIVCGSLWWPMATRTTDSACSRRFPSPGGKGPCFYRKPAKGNRSRFHTQSHTAQSRLLLHT